VALAQRISQSLSGPLGDHGFHVTASVGIAVGSRDDDAESLVRDSDAAMYRAKEKGRDRCEVFDDDTRVRAVRRLELENELRVAMDQGELRIHVQPILSVSSQKPVGAEALVRWDHPRLGLIPPAEFVSLAEETGLVGRLGRWMLDQACHAAQQWRSSGLGDGPLSVSVNLSARQLAQIGLTDEVASALERSGLPPELLCLEITESAVMEDVELSIAVLRSLKNLGVRLSIDDFGTGYSSLSYLKRFPVDELKVDRSFIDGLGHEAHDSSIVSAVVGLAHNLGVKAVAEGVETSLQLAELIELGCDYAQGFLWFRPDDLAGFERWIDGAASDS
jgi:EAL domain-containing protein (putative c-di-GMP-specific phosphodiesterase class I)